MKTVIADFTRAIPGTEDGLLERLGRTYPSDDHIVVIREDQTLCHGRTVTVRPYHYTVVKTQIELLVRDVLESDQERSVDVLTFHSVVFAISSSFAVELKRRLHILPWSAIGRGPSAATQEHPNRDVGRRTSALWPSDIMPSTEAVNILVKALQAVGAESEARAVRKSDIRPLLAIADPRFQKTSPLGATPGLISMLTEAALAAGRILQAGVDSVNPLVWSAPASPKLVNSHPPVERHSSRSQQFVSVLKAQGLGPFPTVRSQLLKAIHAMATQSSDPLPLRLLLMKAVDSVRIDAVDGSGRFERQELMKFLYRILALQPVLFDEQGLAIVPSLSTLRSRVARIDPDYEEKIDSVLLLELVRNLPGDITLNDVESLAGVLFSSREDDAIDRVVHAAERLIEEQRVVDIPGGGLQLA